MRGFLKGIGIVLAGAVFLAAAATVAFPQSAITLIYGVAQNRPTVNASTTTGTAGTFGQILAAMSVSTQRQSLTIQNNNATDTCWLFIGAGSATKPTSIELLAGQAYTRYFPYVPSDEFQATCATTSDPIYIDYQ